MGGMLNTLPGESRVSFDSEALPDGSRFAAVGRFTAIARPDVAWPAEAFRVAEPDGFGAAGPDGFDAPVADRLDAADPDGLDADARPSAPGVSTIVAERDDLEAAAFSVRLDAADFLAGAFERFFGLALAVLTVTTSDSEECSSDESSESSAFIAARSASESEKLSKFWSAVSLPMIDFVFLAGGSSAVSTWSCVRKRRFPALPEDSTSLSLSLSSSSSPTSLSRGSSGVDVLTAAAYDCLVVSRAGRP